MALDQIPVDVSLLPMNQQAPASAGPVGRVERIVNGIVRKFIAGGNGPRMRIEKRPGLTPLATTARSDGAEVAAPSSPKLLDGSWKDQLVLMGGSKTYVRSDAGADWIATSNRNGSPAVVAPYKLSRRGLYSRSTVAYGPDNAAIGNVLCRVLSDVTNGAQVMFADKDGVVLRGPFGVFGTNKAKVTTDGVNFWVFSQDATHNTTFLQIFDTTGTSLGSTSFAWGVARDNWDIGYQSVDHRVFLVTPTGATTTVIYATFVAGVFTATTYTPATDVANGVAVLTNTNGGHNIYIAGTNAGGDVKAYEITATGTVAATYVILLAVGVVGNITGWTTNGSFDLRVAISILANNFAAPLAAYDNKIAIATATHAGVSSLIGYVRSLALVSRVFADADGIYRAWAYYQSSAGSSFGGGADASTTDSQPTYFAVDMSATTPAVVGEMEIGSAAALYAASRHGVHYSPWMLASSATDLAAIQHVPLCVQAQSTVVVGAFVFNTGVNDYMIAPVPGNAVSTADALLLPGLQGSAFDGSSLTEAGIHLAPDVVSIAGSIGAGALTPTESYVYVGIWRALDAIGNVIRSAPSAPLTKVLGLSDNMITLVYATNRTTTRAGMVLEIYRTFSPTSNTSPGVELRKVGETPNNPGADTITFVDLTSDAVAATGQECYAQVLTDSPELDHGPAPAFSSGCTFQLRTLLIGWDGAIWVGSERVEGEVPWFNSLLRIVLPTTDTPLSLTPIDTRVVIRCAESLWVISATGFPNANLTAGSLPTPEQLPFTTGAIGPSLATPAGAIYAADRGIWQMDRALSQQFIGAGVLDETDSASLPTGLAVDDNQRVYVAMSTDGRPLSSSGLRELLVFDLITGSWLIWTPATVPAFLTTWRGRLALVDFDNCQAWVADDPETSSYTDGGAAVNTSVAISSMGFGGASAWQRLWGTELFGTWEGAHRLLVDYTYDNNASASETLAMPAGVDPAPYRFEARQELQKNIAVAITISDSFIWPTLANVVAGTAQAIIVDDISAFTVGTTYSSRTGVTLDAGSFTVIALTPSARRVSYVAAGGWVPVAAHEIIDHTTRLTPGNSFTLESVQLRIGQKRGLGRLPTSRRMT